MSLTHDEKARELAIWATGGVIQFQGDSKEVIEAWTKAISTALKEAAEEARNECPECVHWDYARKVELKSGIEITKLQAQVEELKDFHIETALDCEYYQILNDQSIVYNNKLKARVDKYREALNRIAVPGIGSNLGSLYEAIAKEALNEA